MAYNRYLFNSFEHYGSILRAIRPLVLQLFLISGLMAGGSLNSKVNFEKYNKSAKSILYKLAEIEIKENEINK
ncbi:unnamed protein product [Blepharisma stoltei]|uniref:Uncharacterized protein n=1 Tax=Blepharisma stoltei TaxID=1481888 RepID=A0AAU9IYN6_9CILI|nr:unnamed protein product [Blepharisma stoltei]